VAEQPIKILDGNTFVVSDSAGDIEASSTDPRGLFAYDTRFLNIWRLTVDGNRLTPLSVNDTTYFEAKFFLIPATGSVYSDSEVSVVRRRTIGIGFSEELIVKNHADKAADLTVRIEVGGDFADLFEVKDSLSKVGKYDHRIEPNRLVLSYQRESFCRETSVTSSAPGEVDEHGFTFAVHVEPSAEWRTRLDVGLSGPTPYGDLVQVAYGGRSAESLADNLKRWVDEAPKLDCDVERVTRTYRRSLIDLAALRFSPFVAGRHSLPAAGLPWFMSMFGRDSIITSLQSLPFKPDLAATTIQVLGAWQGSRSDDFRDEDPGRIVHELRYGEMTTFKHRPQSPYYGTADGTPLFVVLLDE
jgi:glycogen debranching enzyme